MASAITMDDANGPEILAMEWTRRPFKNDPRQTRSYLLLKLREEQVPQAVKDSVIRAYVQI